MSSETYQQRDILLSKLGFTNYNKYLCSDLWMSIRSAALLLHGMQCRLCGSRSHVVHHLSYLRDVLLGNDLSKLVPLCGKCHHKVEFNHQDKKRSFEDAKSTFDRLSNPKRGSRCNSCGNRLRKRGGSCRACCGTGVTKFPVGRKATAFLRKQNKT